MAYSTLVSAATLAAHLDDPGWVICDCRFSLADAAAGGRGYRAGHIPGARYVHLDADLSSPVRPYTGRHPLPEPRQLAGRMGEWGISGRSQVVVYDDAGGAFAGRLWWLLRGLGHRQVAVLDGGFGHWRRLGLPVTTRLPQVVPAAFRAYPEPGSWLTASEVENGLAAGDVLLIDARAAERFQGRVEPIDPVAGHVPKAVNRPFQQNLDAAGLFLPAAELARQFRALIAGRPAGQVVHMCGSGVTACHNLLAMEAAGLTGSRLYAGSWSEWIVNPNRAVAVGR